MDKQPEQPSKSRRERWQRVPVRRWAGAVLTTVLVAPIVNTYVDRLDHALGIDRLFGFASTANSQPPAPHQPSPRFNGNLSLTPGDASVTRNDGYGSVATVHNENNVTLSGASSNSNAQTNASVTVSNSNRAAGITAGK